MLVGVISDSEDRKVTFDQAENLTLKHKMKYVEANIKSGDGV